MTSETQAYEIHVVSTLRRLHPRLFAENYERRHGHPLRKASFFAWREGLLPTIRKYRSKKLEQSVDAELSMIIVRIDLGDLSLVMLTRDLGSALCVAPELILKGPCGISLADLVLSDHVMELFESYLPVPECPLADRLAAAVLAANPELGVADRADLARAKQVGALSRADSLGPPIKTPPHLSGSAARRLSAGTGVFFVGFGGYVREYVMPCFGQMAIAACDYRAELIGRHTRPPIPIFPTIEPLLDLIERQTEPLVIIASYHSAHVLQAQLVLAANPDARVFVEKPLGVTAEDIQLVAKLRQQGCWVDVGYNRRYAPLTQMVQALIRREPGPFSMLASIKEISVAPSHWYFWPNQGTRLTANVTHWLDLAVMFAACEPTQVAAVGTPDRTSAVVAFEDGATVSLSASEDGDGLRGVQEYIEVRTRSTTARIRDYTCTEIVSAGVSRTHHLRRRSKGHNEMYQSLRQRWAEGGLPLYPERDMFRLQFLIDECLRQLRSERDYS